MPGTVLVALRRNWWTLVLRGVCAIVFGFFAWFSPRLTLLALLWSWGALACLNGVAALYGAFVRDGQEPRWILVLEGSVSLLAGAAALFFPRLTAMTFLYLLAAWALIAGAFQVIAAWRLRAEIRGEFWLGFAGALSLLFGLLLIFRPGAGALAVLWLIASFSVLYGVILIGWGLHLKRLHDADQQQRSLGPAAIGGDPAPRP